MTALIARVDRALLAAGPARRLIEVRTLLAVAMGVQLVVRPWRQLVDRPPQLFDPVAVVAWLSAPPSPRTVVAVQCVGLVAAVVTVLRLAPRAGFAVAWAAYVFLAAVWGSSGKVMHNDVLLITVAFPLVFAPAPTRAESDSVDVRWGWGPRASLAALAAVYFATGYQKLRHSGLAWVFSDNMSWVLRQGTSVFGHHLNQVVADQPALTRALAAGALALELAAPVLLSIRRTRPLFVLGALLMHASIWLFLGLDYSPWVLASAAVALPLSRSWPPSATTVRAPQRRGVLLVR